MTFLELEEPSLEMPSPAEDPNPAQTWSFPLPVPAQWQVRGQGTHPSHPSTSAPPSWRGRAGEVMPEVCGLRVTSQGPALGTHIPPASPLRGDGTPHRKGCTEPQGPSDAASTVRAQSGHSQTPVPSRGQGQDPKELHHSSRTVCAQLVALQCRATCQGKVQPPHWHRPRGRSNLLQPPATPRGGPHRPTVHPQGTAWVFRRWHRVRSKPRLAGAGSMPAQSRRAVGRSCLHSCAQRGGASQPREGDVWKSTG